MYSMICQGLGSLSGDKTDAYRAMCTDVLAEEFVPMNMEHLHAIESPKSHFVLKKLIKNDKNLHENGESKCDFFALMLALLIGFLFRNLF